MPQTKLLASLACQLFIICTAITLLTACTLPAPETLISPAPLPHNSGKYHNPYKADGSLTAWAEKGVHANRFGAAMAGMAASEAIGFVDVTGLASSGADTLVKQQGAI